MDITLSELLARSDLNETLVKNDFSLACRLAKKQTTCKTVKTLAFILEKIAHGGTERVASRQIDIFHQHGYKIVLITDLECKDEYQVPAGIERFIVPPDENRRKNIIKTLHNLSVDTVIFTDYWSERTMEDIVWARLMDLNVIAEEHNTFFMPLFSNQITLFEKRRLAYSCVNVLTCLNTMDEKLWHASGIYQAVYVPNPMTYDSTANSCKSWDFRENAVVIVGRLVHLKGVYLIPSLIQLITDIKNDVKFYICGSFAHDYDKNWFNNEVKKLGIEDKIHHLGQVDNVSDLMSRVKVQMLPSYIEGSPMVIGEARTLGTPTVMFSMPYVDNAHQGCVQVPMEDINSMANEVVRLITDKNRWTELSNEAQSDLDSWSSGSVWARWKEILSNITTVKINDNCQCQQECLIAMGEFYKGIHLNYRSYKVSNSDPRIQVLISLVNRFFPHNTLRRKALRTLGRIFFRVISRPDH